MKYSADIIAVLSALAVVVCLMTYPWLVVLVAIFYIVIMHTGGSHAER